MVKRPRESEIFVQMGLAAIPAAHDTVMGSFREMVAGIVQGAPVRRRRAVERRLRAALDRFDAAARHFHALATDEVNRNTDEVNELLESLQQPEQE